MLRAKAIVFGGATGLAMTLGAFGAFFAGSAVYSGNLPSHSIGDPGVLRAVLSVGFYGACVALIGIAGRPRAQHCDGDRPPAGTADAGPVVGGPRAGHGR